MAKPDFMVIVPDLYRRRRRHQGRRRLPSLPPEPQGHLKMLFMSRNNFENLQIYYLHHQQTLFRI